ncbi:MAG: CDP-glycerol glycerophosphotransferase family protein [Betaproteobacteria bacterium]
MPLVVANHPQLDTAALAYPGVRVERASGVGIADVIASLGRMVRERAPQAVFYSELASRKLLRALLGGTRDAPRVVYIPHGFSEKRQDWARGTAFQDIAVLYGQHAFDQLAAFGVAGYLHHFIVSGNVRRRYHAMHEATFRVRLAALGLEPRPDLRTVLYAPTWDDALGSSSFFPAFAAMVRELPTGWRLIAKLHPHLDRHAATLDDLARQCRGRDVHLVRGTPLSLPFLDLADAYVGDMSSLAYDFLGSGRPMFFTNAAAGTAADAAGSRLFACGSVVAPDRYGEIYRIIDDAWASDADRFGEARAALERYTHAPERTLEDVAEEMDDVLAGPPPTWMYAKLDPPPAAPR